MVKVSVIVPIYNGQRFLAQCLQSLCGQSLQDIEIIAINNGSSDDSAHILEEFSGKDPRIKIILLIQNVGVFGARNRGIKEATGKYIAFCDCDDIVPVDAYEMMLNKCEEENLDVVTANYKEIVCQDGSIREIDHVRRRTGFYGYMLGGAIWNRMFRRAFLELHHLRFDAINHGEDTLFMAEVFANGAVAGTLKNIVYHYYIRLESQTSLALHCSQTALEEYFYAEEAILKVAVDKVAAKEFQRYRKEKFYYLRERWWSIENITEKEACYHLIREMALDVLSDEEEFRYALCVSPQIIGMLDFGSYIAQVPLYNSPAQRALREFQRGGIGFRYIIAYIKAWAQYKFSRRK